MKHPFKYYCEDADALLKGVGSLSTFMKRLTDNVGLNTNKTTYEDYVGGALELLVEVLITYSPIDKRINIVDYEPVLENDYGIDGVGKSHNGNVHTVQVKYRSNTDKLINNSEDHISNFGLKSVNEYGNKVDMTIFTTAKDLHYKIRNEIFEGKKYTGTLRVVGYKELSQLINKNPEFWKLLKKHLKED